MHLYFQQIEQLLHKIATQQDKLQTIAQIIAKKLEKGGIIQLFGAGHSFLLAEEAFYRAGGLVPVKPMIYTISNDFCRCNNSLSK